MMTDYLDLATYKFDNAEVNQQSEQIADDVRVNRKNVFLGGWSSCPDPVPAPTCERICVDPLVDPLLVHALHNRPAGRTCSIASVVPGQQGGQYAHIKMYHEEQVNKNR